MKPMQFEEMFPWHLARALTETAIGVLELRGEHNAVGLDASETRAVCVRVA